MLEVCGLTDPGCVRANNEDYFLVEPELGLFLVADGMGGAQAGEHASRMASDFVRDKVRLSPVRSSELLVQAIQEANQAVMQAATKNPQLEGMGTTLVALWESTPTDGAEPELLVASVGDSRAYVCDDRGLREVTDDQTWVNEIGRRLGIDDATLKVHPMRHVLTMAIGVSQPLRVNTYRISLRPGIQVLLCSDGLHGVIPASIISEGMMNNARSLEEKCRFLVDAARSAGGPDNITTVIVRAS